MPDEATLVRHEEEARVDSQWEVVGALGARRTVEHEQARQQFPRHVERLSHERVPVREGDSGQIETLADGSVSIPLFEEELVVTRKTVLRERVIIRKELTTDWQVVQTDLRKERVQFDTTSAPRDAVVGAEEPRGRGWMRPLRGFLRRIE